MPMTRGIKLLTYYLLTSYGVFITYLLLTYLSSYVIFVIVTHLLLQGKNYKDHIKVSPAAKGNFALVQKRLFKMGFQLALLKV